MVQQDLSVNLIGKDVSASDALRRLASAANQAAKSAGDSLDQMNRRVETSSQRSLTTVTSGFSDRLSSWAQSGLAGVLGGITSAVTYGVLNTVSNAGDAILTQLKSSVIDYNSQLEQATIGFTTMLGSSGKAQKFLDQLQAFATRTPFEFGDLTTFSQQMLAYGVNSKNVVPYLTALGDAAAGAGKSSQDLGNAVLAFNQLSAKATVDLGNLNQLTNNGIPALAILADKYGVTKDQMFKMISSSKILSKDALPKLIDGIEHGTKSTAAMGGMMDKQSQTLQGAMSNISDAMNQTLSTAFKPFFKVAEQAALSLQKFAGSKAVQKWATDTSRSMGHLVSQVGEAFNAIGQDKGVQAALKRLGPAVEKAFAQVGPAVQKILPNLVKFGRDALPGIVDGFVQIAQATPAFLHDLEGMSKSLGAAGKSWGDFASFVGGAVGNTIRFLDGLDGWFKDALAPVYKFRDQFYAFMSGLPAFAESAMLQIGGHLVSGLWAGISGSWGGVMANIQGLVNQIPLAVRKLLGIASPSKVMAEIGGWVGKGLSKGLLGTVDQVKSSSKTLADSITAAFKKGTISKGTETAALGAVSSMTKKLSALANERAKVQDKLANLRSARADVQTSTYESVRNAGDITSFAAPGDAVSGLQRLIGKTKTFTADLNALAKKGIGQRMLSQLVDGWQSDPDNALATAQGLLSNPTDLKNIISLQTQLQHAAGALGRAAGSDLYASDISTTSGKAKALTWEMQAAARSGLKTVSRDLHVHLTVNGTYAGTSDALTKKLAQEFRDAVKKGVIPKNWASA